MYLHLHDGPAPLDTAENPLAPGAKPSSFSVGYPALGQAGDEIILPDDLFKQSPAGFVDALKKLEKLYKDFQSGRKVDPANIVKRAARQSTMANNGNRGMAGPTLALILTNLPVIISAAQSILGNLSAGLVNNQISQLYAANAYNVQNLNRMNLQQLNLQIERLDSDISSLGQFQYIKGMTLAQFRLVYQRRFDNISGFTGVLSNLPAWLVPVGIGLAAIYLIRRK